MSSQELKPAAVADLEKFVECGCSTPGCTHDHGGKSYIEQRCHPGGGLAVFYEKGTGVVTIECHKCAQPVIKIAVALISP